MYATVVFTQETNGLLFFSLISLAQDVDYTVQILLPLCTCNNLAIGLEHCWSLENILKKDKTILNGKRVMCHMYNISRTVAHLLPSPGTILVLLLFGALNFPFTSVVQCRGANVVGCWLLVIFMKAFPQSDDFFGLCIGQGHITLSQRNQICC